MPQGIASGPTDPMTASSSSRAILPRFAALPLSPDRTVGSRQVDRLKRIKRRICGRAKLDLLESRLLGSLQSSSRLRGGPGRNPIAGWRIRCWLVGSKAVLEAPALIACFDTVAPPGAAERKRPRATCGGSDRMACWSSFERLVPIISTCHEFIDGNVSGYGRLFRPSPLGTGFG